MALARLLAICTLQNVLGVGFGDQSSLGAWLRRFRRWLQLNSSFLL